MKDKIAQLRKEASKLAESLEDKQIYGVAELLNIVVENLDEAIEEYEEYEADQE